MLRKHSVICAVVMLAVLPAAASSSADNLVPNDRNDNWDVFLHRGPPLAGH